MTKENTINLDNSDVSTDIESVDSTGGFYEEDNFEETVILREWIKNLQLEREKVDFIRLMDLNSWSFQTKSTSGFWIKNKEKLLIKNSFYFNNINLN